MRKARPRTQNLITARCDKCVDKLYFGRIYTEREWTKTPKCDTCKGPLTELRRQEMPLL